MKRPKRDADHLFYSVDVYPNSMPSWPAQGPLVHCVELMKVEHFCDRTFIVKYDTFAHKSKLQYRELAERFPTFVIGKCC